MSINAPVGPGRHSPSLARYAGLFSIVCLALAFGSTSATAGFFDFLFPPPHPAQPVYRLPPQQPQRFFHRRPAHVEHRHFGHPQKKAVAARPHKTIEAKAPLLQRVTGLMEDESLKEGDAVMTEGGIRVFVGSEGSRHKSNDFAPLSESRGLSRRQRSALLAMDPGHDGAGVQPVLLAGRSAADKGLSAGEMIVDPRGVKIRYVGP